MSILSLFLFVLSCVGIKTQRGTRNIHGHGPLVQLRVPIATVVEFTDVYPIGKNPQAHWMRNYFHDVHHDDQFTM